MIHFMAASHARLLGVRSQVTFGSHELRHTAAAAGAIAVVRSFRFGGGQTERSMSLLDVALDEGEP
jgi:hypothetical protein